MQKNVIYSIHSCVIETYALSMCGPCVHSCVGLIKHHTCHVNSARIPLTHTHTPNVNCISHNCFLMVLAGAYHAASENATYSKPVIKNI